MILEHEIEFYNKNKQEWINEGYEGKFVLIKYVSGECWHFDMFDSMEKAYNEGVEIYGNVPMLIREIRETEPIHRI